MKITKSQLKQIIKEEVDKTLMENWRKHLREAEKPFFHLGHGKPGTLIASAKAYMMKKFWSRYPEEMQSIEDQGLMDALLPTIRAFKNHPDNPDQDLIPPNFLKHLEILRKQFPEGFADTEEKESTTDTGINFKSREEAIAYVAKIQEDLLALEPTFKNNAELYKLYDNAIGHLSKLRFAVEKN